MSKFENLVLARLLWKSAKVHFESAVFTEKIFVYQSDPESLGKLENELAGRDLAKGPTLSASWARVSAPALCPDLSSPSAVGDFRPAVPRFGEVR